MAKTDPAFFHKLNGIPKPRVTYYERDFLDYVLMIVLTALAAGVSYGFGHVMSNVVFALCAVTLAMFAFRHGVEFRVPVILRRPQDVVYAFVYKLQNLRPMYFIALGVLLLENVLIAATPNLPHHVDAMRTVAVYLFYIHLLSITAYRTAILVDHLVKKEHVREVLMQTAWKRVINEKTNITLEIVHAYCTGLLTHIVLIAPWYLVITYSSFSVIFLPAVFVINIIVSLKWWQGYNAWFYRDHWLGHNSEVQFIFLHGTHHDAIPSGLIAGTETGFLEGFLRFAMAWPVPFFNPVLCFALCTYDVKTDIHLHQYIPGIFPRIPIRMMDVIQHSTHHYGSIEPYGVGLKVDAPGVSEDLKKTLARIPDGLKNSARLDEELTAFKWDNPTHRRLLSLYEKYQG
jgi:hypothetical protein